MNHLSMTWLGPSPLLLELTELAGISLEVWHPAWGPSTVTLWRTNGTGLKVSSQMHDVAERLELGVLSVELVREPRPSETVVKIPAAFKKGAVACKLVVHEADTTAESGIAITASDGNEIIVIAGAGPCSLAVRGVLSSIPHIFEPEYPLERYARVPFA